MFECPNCDEILTEREDTNKETWEKTYGFACHQCHFHIEFPEDIMWKMLYKKTKEVTRVGIHPDFFEKKEEIKRLQNVKQETQT
jgi:DNA-directed RNA polymerase subunit M/transcription elongation factor TFIIS